VHHGGVREVAVRQADPVDALVLDQPRRILFRIDGYTASVQMARQCGWIVSPRDVRNLGRREGNHAIGWIVTEDRVEIMEIAPGCTHDNDPAGAALTHTFASPQVQ